MVSTSDAVELWFSLGTKTKTFKPKALQVAWVGSKHLARVYTARSPSHIHSLAPGPVGEAAA